MRTLHTDKIIEAVKEMCISANLYLADDMDGKIRQAAKEEDSTLGKQILNQLIENMEIAGEDKTPICQDTGMAVFFVNVGQNLHIEGMNLTDAINEGVRRGYTEGYLRKSVVKDPLQRENTGDNTPAIIHYDIEQGVYAEAGRWRRRNPSVRTCSSQGCRTKCLSADGSRCRTWR